MDETDNTTN